MLKIIGVGLLACTVLGMFLIFPFAAIGTGIAIFCLWRGWYIAALILFLVGVSIQLCRGITGDEGDGYSDYEDHDGDSDLQCPDIKLPCFFRCHYHG